MILSIAVIYSSASRADSYRVGYVFNMPPLAGGSVATTDNALQSHSPYGHRFELVGKNGSDLGFLYGVGYGLQKIEHDQMNTASRLLSAHYVSTYNYPFIKIGFWKDFENKISVETSVNYGWSRMKFQRDADSTKISNAKSVDIDLRAVGAITKFENGTKVNVILGVELFKQYVKDFGFDGRAFGSGDFRPLLMFSGGVGFEF